MLQYSIQPNIINTSSAAVGWWNSPYLLGLHEKVCLPQAKLWCLPASLQNCIHGHNSRNYAPCRQCLAGPTLIDNREFLRHRQEPGYKSCAGCSRWRLPCARKHYGWRLASPLSTGPSYLPLLTLLELLGSCKFQSQLLTVAARYLSVPSKDSLQRKHRPEMMQTNLWKTLRPTLTT